MNDLRDGFIIQPRKFFKSSDWLEPRTFSKSECWLDCIAMAKFEPCSQTIKYKKINLNRGDFIASVRFLSNRWGFSVGKVKRLLDYFEENNQIERRIEHNITIITVANYDKYQCLSNYVEHKNEHNVNDTGTRPEQNKININNKNKKGVEIEFSSYEGLKQTYPDRDLSWLSEKSWNEWNKYRKEIRKKLTMSIIKKQLTFLAKNKQDSSKILEKSIMNGWTGLFELKGKNYSMTPQEEDRLRKREKQETYVRERAEENTRMNEILAQAKSKIAA